MDQAAEAKSNRLLTIYFQLQNGKNLQRAQLAEQFGVSERSIRRDIEDLRCFLAEQGLPQEILSDCRGYRLVTSSPEKPGRIYQVLVKWERVHFNRNGGRTHDGKAG